MSELSDFNLDQRVQTTVGDIMEYARVAYDKGWADAIDPHGPEDVDERYDNPFIPRETIEVDYTLEEVV